MDPLTRCAPAGENAGSATPSPAEGRGNPHLAVRAAKAGSHMGCPYDNATWRCVKIRGI